jgi:type 2 lantibiotic biosynthesis protein LanM
MLSFEDGFRVIYKPRSLSAERHFSELASWLAQYCQHDLRSPAMLERSDYGWAEFVEHAACDSHEQLQRFYRRVGYLTVLLYLTNATDVHYDNFVASGEHPILVDTESIFSPDASSVRGILSEGPQPAVPGPLARTGLLANYLLDNDFNPTVDLGAITSNPNSDAVGVGLHIDAAASDLMRIAELPGRWASTGKNLPTIGPVVADPNMFQAEIAEGLTEAFDAVEANKQDLANRIIPIFTNDRVRFLLRSTGKYARVRFDLYHPDMLRDAAERMRLWVSMYNIRFSSYHALLWSEIGDLESQDVPYFSFLPGGVDISCSDGSSIRSFFDEAPLEVVRRKILGLNKAELPGLLWELKSSFSRCQSPNRRSLSVPSGKGDVHLKALSLANSIASELCENIRINDTQVEVFGYRIMGHRWSIGSLGPQLYDGLAGIALFLAYAGHHQKNEIATHCAQRIALRLRQYVADVLLGREQLRTGAFLGVGGIIYLFVHLAALFDAPQLLTDALLLAEASREVISTEKEVDVVSGCAGLIPCLLLLAEATLCETPIRIAAECADHLLKTAIRTVGNRLSWRAFGSRPPMCGFAHGAAGIAWALSLLAKQDERYLLAALRAIGFDRPLHSLAKDENVAINVTAQPESHIPSAKKVGSMVTSDWCRGTCGIGMACIGILQRTREEVLVDMISDALCMIVRQHTHPVDCLCHGELGILTFLWEARNFSPRDLAIVAFERRRANLIDSIEERGPICGSVGSMTVPGFMTGLAGVGYGLLSLAQPGALPNVLMLEGPTNVAFKAARPIS